MVSSVVNRGNRLFVLNDTATTEIYTLSLHDALPIFERAVELDFRRCVRSIAELVLQPHERDRVACAVGSHARQQEAREARGGLREDEVCVALRRREEPLVAAHPVAAGAVRLGASDVRANVAAALSLGHA